MRVSFDLGSNDFDSQVPSEIGLLKFAEQSIDLSRNKITGPVRKNVSGRTFCCASFVGVVVLVLGCGGCHF